MKRLSRKALAFMLAFTMVITCGTAFTNGRAFAAEEAEEAQEPAEDIPEEEVPEEEAPEEEASEDAEADGPEAPAEDEADPADTIIEDTDDAPAAEPVKEEAKKDDTAVYNVYAEASPKGTVSIWVNPTKGSDGRFNESPVGTMPVEVHDGDVIGFKFNAGNMIAIEAYNSYISYTGSDGTTKTQQTPEGSGDDGYWGYHYLTYDASKYGESITILTESGPNGPVFAHMYRVEVRSDWHGTLRAGTSATATYCNVIADNDAHIGCNPNKHYELDEWAIIGVDSGEKVTDWSENPGWTHHPGKDYKFTMPAEDVICLAKFKPVDSIVTVEMGEGHETLAGTLAAGLAEKYDASADGSTITLYYPQIKDDAAVTVGSAQKALQTDISRLITSTDNNEQFVALAQNTIDNYTSLDEISDEMTSTDEIPAEQTFYAIWEKPVTKIEVTVDPPVCGEVTCDSTTDPANQEPRPTGEVTSEGAHFDSGYWASKRGYADDVFSGTIIYGEEYDASIKVVRDFGYYFNAELFDSITCNGKAVPFGDIKGSSLGYREFYFKQTAEHDPGEPEQEDVIEPTCEEDGSCTEVVKCKGCGEIISRTENTVIPATGHDWGEWETVKEATETETGLKRRVCANDPEHIEEEEIPMLEPSEEESEASEDAAYTIEKGDGGKWTKGSGKAYEFVVKRSADDDLTFENFTGVSIDGTVLESADFTAEAGSIILNIKAEYLEKLSKGSHDITITFKDGKASGRFTIEEKAADKTPDKSGDPSTKTGDDFDINLWIVLLIGAAAAIVVLLAVKKRSKKD